MTSFVISTLDKKKRIELARELCLERKINKFDISIIELEKAITTSKASNVLKQSIGIEQIKNIQRTLFFKPLKSDTKAVIIEDAHLLTPEAQNALLKVLEEPPLHTIIILGTQTTEALLPTILSRCQILRINEIQVRLSDQEQSEFDEFLNQAKIAPIGTRLKKAEELAKDKDKAILWIEKYILYVRQRLLVSSGLDQSYLITLIRSFQTLHTRLKTTNVNARFAIENTLLNL